MKRTTFSILTLLFSFVLTTSFLCSKESDRIDGDPCDDTQPEFVCLTVNGENYFTTNIFKHTVSNTEIDISDNSNQTKLYLAIDTDGPNGPTVLGTGGPYTFTYDYSGSGNVTAILNAGTPTSQTLAWGDLDWGIGDGVGMDTIFTSGSIQFITVAQNSGETTYATFTATGAKKINTAVPQPDPNAATIAVTATGQFKVKK